VSNESEQLELHGVRRQPPSRGKKFIIRLDRDMKNERTPVVELRHLRYFITLAEELHFARAAERLEMEQSPLSRAIREMERLLGVRLFERNTRSTRITRAGKVLFDDAKRVIELVEQAKESARSAALGHSNQLRIGVSDCTAYSRILETLARYRTANPHVSVTLHEMSLHQQISRIRDNLLDASISLDGSYRDGIESQAVAHDAIGAVVPIAHPWAHAKVAPSTELVRHPLILFSAESDLGAGSEIENFVETLGRPHIAFRASSLGTMLTLVALGHGVGLLGSGQMMGLSRRDVAFRRLDGATPLLTTRLLHSNCGVSEPVAAFIEMAQEACSSADSTAEPS
jgi:DNA-binding transcriptional LysR family regulator